VGSASERDEDERDDEGEGEGEIGGNKEGGAMRVGVGMLEMRFGWSGPGQRDAKLAAKVEVKVGAGVGVGAVRYGGRGESTPAMQAVINECEETESMSMSKYVEENVGKKKGGRDRGLSRAETKTRTTTTNSWRQSVRSLL